MTLGVMDRATVGILLSIRHLVGQSSLPQQLRMRAATYLAVNCLNLSGAGVARAAGISRQRVGASLRAVEAARRVSQAVDQELDRLEALLTGHQE